jgi:hypothetical protein
MSLLGFGEPGRTGDAETLGWQISRLPKFIPQSVSRGWAIAQPNSLSVRGNREPIRGQKGGYKDAQGRIKRQAARFRLFGYDSGGKLVGEVTAKDADISWTVHLANAKAAWNEFDGLNPNAPKRNAAVANRNSLIIDPGPRSLSGRTKSAAFDTGNFLGVIVPLGEIRTDTAGRLIVLGGLVLQHHLQTPGWHVDRARFDAMLVRSAEEAGAKVYRGADLSSCITDDWGHRLTEFASEDVKSSIRSKFIVDATGRSSVVARRQGAARASYDRLVGLVGFVASSSGYNGSDSFTLVEAIEDGWWYSAILPDLRLVVAFMTDADLL